MRARRLAQSFLGVLVVGSLANVGIVPVGAEENTAQAGEPVAPFIVDTFARDGAVDVVYIDGDVLDWDVMADWSVTVTAQPGGRQAVVTDPAAGTARVTGLTNGTEYTFTAVERSNGKTSARSDPSDPVSPTAAAPPLAPTIDSVRERDGSLDVDWNSPSDGGALVISYQVVVQPGNKKVMAPAQAHTATVDGLINGTAYTVSVAAANKAGLGPAAVESGVTPRPDHAPGAPEDVSVLPSASGDQHSLDVAWVPPVDDGGTAITGYIVTANPGGMTVSVPGDQTTARLTGLDPDTEYDVTVAASNSAAARSERSASATAMPGVKYGPDTIRLSEEAIGAITRVTATTVEFNRPLAQLQPLAPNKIIAVAARNPAPKSGLLRRVTSITESNGKTIAATSQAKLEEAIDTAEFKLAPPKGWINGAKVRSTEPGARTTATVLDRRLNIDMKFKPKSSDNPKDKKQSTANAGYEASLTGTAGITPKWDMDFKIGFFKVKSAHAWATVKADASLNANFKAFYSKSVEPKKPLADVKFTCYKFFIGWFPVMICPTFTLKIGAQLDGSLEMGFTASYEQTFGGKLSYSSADGWKSENLTTKPVTNFTSKMQAQVGITIELPANLSLMFWDVAGPGLTLSPYLAFSADTARTPWAKIDLGLKVLITFKVTKFISLDKSAQVYDGKTTIWESKSKPVVLVITPATKQLPLGGKLKLTAKRTGCANSKPIVWSLAEGAKGTIAQDGTYRAPPKGSGVQSTEDKVLAKQASDGSCGGTNGHAIIHSGSQRPSPPLNVKAKKKGNDIVLTWDPPTQLYGTLKHYLVEANHPEDDIVGYPKTNTFTLKDGVTKHGWGDSIYTISAVNLNGAGLSSAYAKTGS